VPLLGSLFRHFYAPPGVSFAHGCFPAWLIIGLPGVPIELFGASLLLPPFTFFLTHARGQRIGDISRKSAEIGRKAALFRCGLLMPASAMPRIPGGRD
jgi:hypothetical protein